MRSNDESARRAAQQPRKRQIDLRLPLVRSGARLAQPASASDASDALPLGDIVRTASAAADRPGAFLIGGGDALGRADLWDLLAELQRLRPEQLGLYSAGQGMTTAMVDGLRAAGVERVGIPFHCARQDAHDWLVGQPGALKTAHRAIRVCLDAGVSVTADLVLTRPTMPHLAETIEVLARLGVRSVCVRRLTASSVDGPAFVPLSPRLGLLEESLEHAATVALERRVRLRLRDLPLCVAPRLRPLFAAPDSEVWLTPEGAARSRATPAVGCATCPGWPRCAGAPVDYVSRFGWEEFVDPSTTVLRLREAVAEQQAGRATAPLAFAWRGPQRVRCAACGDAAGDAPAADATRAIRALLVQAARQRPSVLRLVGADLLAHPQAAQLLYDAVRLFPRVEVAGEASPVADWSDLDLRRIKDLLRFDVALYGFDAATHDAHCGIPGAFAAMLRAVTRLRTRTPIQVGAYAIVHDASQVAAFAEAWQRGELPGEPRFRLSGRGGSLDELADCASALPPGKARTALLSVLPRCVCDAAGLVVEDDALARRGMDAAEQQRMQWGRSVAHHPCGSDPLGAFEACRDSAGTCTASGCPGIAVGWHSTARARRWTVNT